MAPSDPQIPTPTHFSPSTIRSDFLTFILSTLAAEAADSDFNLPSTSSPDKLAAVRHGFLYALELVAKHVSRASDPSNWTYFETTSLDSSSSTPTSLPER